MDNVVVNTYFAKEHIADNEKMFAQSIKEPYVLSPL